MLEALAEVTVMRLIQKGQTVYSLTSQKEAQKQNIINRAHKEIMRHN